MIQQMAAMMVSDAKRHAGIYQLFEMYFHSILSSTPSFGIPSAKRLSSELKNWLKCKVLPWL